MKAPVGRHWIAGEWRDVRGSAVFELRQRVPPHERAGSWPRGDAGLVADALLGSREGLELWREGSPEDRSRVISRAVEVLRAAEDWREHLDRYLGLRGPELENEDRTLERVQRSFEDTPPEEAAESGVTVVFAHWSELLSTLFERMVRHLASGRGVLLVSDDRWPAGADAIARALDEAGLPSGLVSVLHGAQEVCQTALLSDAGTVPAERAPAIAAIRDSEVPFSIDLGQREPGNRSYVVDSEADLTRCATDVVARAFGRASTLSGQRLGRVGRVICHRRVFSPFTEMLLATMQTSSDVRDPVPLIDGRAFAELRVLWELGLDEGATLVFGGETFTGGTARSSDRRVWAAVFTNVEAGMALCRSSKPAPVLSLVRADSDQVAQSLARELG